MKLSISADSDVYLKGQWRLGASAMSEMSTRFDEIQEALNFADETGIDLSDDPIALGYKLGGIAVQISESKLDAAEIQKGMVFGTSPAWIDAMRNLAEIILNAANELERE
jgi:hypothetical protein